MRSAVHGAVVVSRGTFCRRFVEVVVLVAVVVVQECLQPRRHETAILLDGLYRNTDPRWLVI